MPASPISAMSRARSAGYLPPSLTLRTSSAFSSDPKAPRKARTAASGFLRSKDEPKLKMPTTRKPSRSGRGVGAGRSGTGWGTTSTGLSVWRSTALRQKVDGTITASTKRSAAIHSRGSVSSSQAQYPMLKLRRNCSGPARRMPGSSIGGLR